jgi:hypothetical protein
MDEEGKASIIIGSVLLLALLWVVKVSFHVFF